MASRPPDKEWEAYAFDFHLLKYFETKEANSYHISPYKRLQISHSYPMSELKGILEVQPLFPLREIQATFSFGPLIFTYKGPITNNTTPIRSIRSTEAWLNFDTLEDLKGPSTFQGSMGRGQFSASVAFSNGVTIRAVLS
ncbi:hypothetical protein SISSUDRAFT_1133484 [Sistotremastrum suecicum HHB10207 ss-3]|uniref:Uncharacterized protein n=1 Tax=Sistotremastrum suecicum HHB10207 ss-3 TaxID=1314776 RepID=A0A165X477_9AGAM|nr:hypothetical protein SISSUDRAFT_1133484 [Sistotremastrum suecicum HHB10207 ss-3]